MFRKAIVPALIAAVLFSASPVVAADVQPQIFIQNKKETLFEKKQREEAEAAAREAERDEKKAAKKQAEADQQQRENTLKEINKTLPPGAKIPNAALAPAPSVPSTCTEQERTQVKQMDDIAKQLRDPSTRLTPELQKWVAYFDGRESREYVIALYARCGKILLERRMTTGQKDGTAAAPFLPPRASEVKAHP